MAQRRPERRQAIGSGGKAAGRHSELVEGALEIGFVSFKLSTRPSHADEPSAPGAWLSANLKDGGMSGLVAKPLADTELAEGSLETCIWLWSALHGFEYIPPHGSEGAAIGS